MNVFVALRYPFTIENYLVLFDVLLFILFFSVDLNLLYSSNGRSALLKTTNAFTTLPYITKPRIPIHKLLTHNILIQHQIVTAQHKYIIDHRHINQYILTLILINKLLAYILPINIY
jgi:hypothetical protein